MSMETDRLYRSPDGILKSVSANPIFYAGCVAFLFVSIVGITFLQIRFVELGGSLGGDLNVPGESDTLRQFGYLGAFVALVVSYVNQRGIASLRTLVPLHVYFLFAWSAATLLWASTPELGGRRLVILAITVVCSFTMVSGLGVERAARFLISFLFVAVLVSLIAGLLFPTVAIHQYSSVNEDLVGDWRGIFAHKNGAGYISAVCIIGLIFSRLHYGVKAAGIAVSGILLWLSQAKTAMGFLPVSLLVYVVIVVAPRRLNKMIITITLLSILTVGLLFINEIEEILSNPVAMTGRVYLWSLIIEYLKADDHFLTGGGFGSVWVVGTATPLLPYLGGWTRYAAHSHNGFLNLLVETGFPGLVLGVYTFFIWPLLKLRRQSALSDRTRDLIICLLIFSFMHNFLESDIMTFSGSFVILAICCAVVFESCRSPDRVS